MRQTPDDTTRGPGPVRVTVASLRSETGAPLGRFAVYETETRRWHRWEWLDDRWPTRAFVMAPDPRECEPAPGLGQSMPLPGWLVRPAAGEPFAPGEPGEPGQRLYDVFCADGPRRLLAALVVTSTRLAWWEDRRESILDAMPDRVIFEPRRAPIERYALTRCVMQTIQPAPTGPRVASRAAARDALTDRRVMPSVASGCWPDELPPPVLFPGAPVEW